MTRYINCELACAEVDKGGLLVGNNAEWAKEIICRTPAADVVSKAAYEQILWERNIAMEQLSEHGIGFGAKADDIVKVIRCKECRYRQDGLYCRRRKEHPYIVTNVDFCSYGEKNDR